MNVGALLPAYVDENYSDQLNGFLIGLLMAVFPLGYLCTAPIIGSILSKMGRKKVIIVGVSIMTVATCIFGVAGYFTNVWWFYSVSMFARFLQGIGDATCNVSLPSVVA
jgi:MFS family permease